jgi:phage head maturation protease
MTVIMTQLDEGYRADLPSATVHDIDDAHHQVLVAFPHNRLDTYRTDWAPGCWDDSLAERMPAMVWNHNPDLIIGRGVRAQTFPDRTELTGQYADFDAVPKAREAYALERDHMVPGWSFHYREGQSIEHPSVRGARRFVKARMLEFSPVTFPSVPGAQATGLRAEEANPMTPTISELRALVADGSITEDGFRALVAQHYPDLREHIHVQPPPLPATAALSTSHPSVADIVALHERGLCDEAGMRALIQEHHPEIAGHLMKMRPVFDQAALEAVRAQVAETYGDEVANRLRADVATGPDESGTEGMTRCPTCKGMGHMIGDNPSPTGPLCPTCDGRGWVDDDGGRSDDAADLAAAIDAALDAANALLVKVPTDGMRADMQQVVALVQAAGVAADELLEVMGIEDVDTVGRRAKKAATKDEDDTDDDDDDDEEADSEPDGDEDEDEDEDRPFKGAAPLFKKKGKRAMVGTKERNDLPDSAFAYIEPGGEKDSEGKTTPRSKRHFLIHDAAHVRNALARIGQGAEFGQQALPAVKRAAKKFGIDVGDDNDNRSAEEELAAFFKRRTPAPV